MLTKYEIIRWLTKTDERELIKLWRMADDARRLFLGDNVHLRGIIELSNHCDRSCWYCGINAKNKRVNRYLLTEDEVMEAVDQIITYGYKTVVIQAGETQLITTKMITSLVKSIKKKADLAITLSLGERSADDLRAFRNAGADRYLIKFETSNSKLYHRIHPTQTSPWKDRFEIIAFLQKLGYEVGSGIMVGIPGQTIEILAEDIMNFKTLGLDMISAGPFIPHPDTKLGQLAVDRLDINTPDSQVPNNEQMTYKVNALARILCPNANIPTTTALSSINSAQGRELGLNRGANVIMPNVTPIEYRQLYEIYPNRICIKEFDVCAYQKIRERILSIGRQISQDTGTSRQYLSKQGG